MNARVSGGRQSHTAGPHRQQLFQGTRRLLQLRARARLGVGGVLTGVTVFRLGGIEGEAKPRQRGSRLECQFKGEGCWAEVPVQGAPNTSI
jgi:hypothetical protein